MAQPPAHPPRTMKQLITLRLGAAGFVQHWKHCDLVANYLATFTSELLNQTEAHANLISTVLNELLEVIFRRNAGAGQIAIVLIGDETALFVQITVPVGDADRAFYQDIAELVARQDADSVHRERLAQMEEDEHSLSMGLLELAVVYGAVLEITPAEDGGEVVLQLPFRLSP